MLAQATVTETQQSVYELAGRPAGWWALGGLLLIVALCYAVGWLYRRERRVGAGRRLRALLAVGRCVVLLGLVAIWLNPVMATYIIRSIRGQVAVLVDVSASMSVVDGEVPVAGSPAERLTQVRRLLTSEDGRWLQRLHEHNDLSLYVFGNEVNRLTLPWDRPNADEDIGAESTNWRDSLVAIAELRAVAPHTDIGQALATVWDDLGDSPIAGVVLISDGGVNKGMSVDELATQASRGRAPVYAVGVGALHEPPNLRIASITAPGTVTPGDPFSVCVELASGGVAAAELEVELSIEDDQGDERVIAQRRTRLDDEGATAPLDFTLDPPEPGTYTYKARVKPVDGMLVEAIADDNVREVQVEVLDRRLRVLLVSAGPSYEYRFVSRLLERDQSIDVSCWMQSADVRAVRDGNTPIKALPREAEDLFAYDAVLLLDPNPAEFDSRWALMLRRLVDEFGGGLLVQAGPHFTARMLRDIRLQDLVGILPVVPDPEAEMRMQALATRHRRPTPMQLPPATEGHPLVTLHPEADANRQVWEALGGPWWYLPVSRAKPIASRLLEHGDMTQSNQHGPALLMAVQPVGSGRTAFLGFDATWRWRATAEQYYERFWINLVRYLAYARREGASRRGTIVLDRESFHAGDYVRIEARLLDPTYAPWGEPKISAEIELPDGTSHELSLEAIPQRAGWFAGRLLVEEPGTTTLRVPIPEADTRDRTGQLVKRISVQRADDEMRTLRLRADWLGKLARDTGGEYSRLSEVGDLPDEIKPAGRRKPPQQTAAEPLWDRGWVLIVLALLLSVEWTLRRRNHLL
ncbi:MAG: hypothetical protein ABIG44_01130 [Planctomycetota bacterium]